MDAFTPIQILARDHLAGNTTRGLDGTATLPAVVDYLRLFCPVEDDLLLFSEHRTPATNTGQLLAVTKSHIGLVQFGRRQRGEFDVGGWFRPLHAVTAVKIRPESRLWPDGNGGGSTDPSLEVEVQGADPLTIGYDATFAWTPRSINDVKADAAACRSLLGRLGF